MLSNEIILLTNIHITIITLIIRIEKSRPKILFANGNVKKKMTKREDAEYSGRQWPLAAICNDKGKLCEDKNVFSNIFAMKGSI